LGEKGKSVAERGASEMTNSKKTMQPGKGGQPNEKTGKLKAGRREGAGFFNRDHVS